MAVNATHLERRQECRCRKLMYCRGWGQQQCLLYLEYFHSFVLLTNSSFWRGTEAFILPSRKLPDSFDENSNLPHRRKERLVCSRLDQLVSSCYCVSSVTTTNWNKKITQERKQTNWSRQRLTSNLHVLHGKITVFSNKSDVSEESTDGCNSCSF